MLVGVTGRPCSGKSLVARFLEERCGFVQLTALGAPQPTPAPNTAPSTGVDAATRPPQPTADLARALPADCWRAGHDYVLCPVDTPAQVEALRKRPYFLLLSVDAPITLRYARYRRRWHAALRRDDGGRGECTGVDHYDGGGDGNDRDQAGTRDESAAAREGSCECAAPAPLSLEQFVRADDAAYFGSGPTGDVRDDDVDDDGADGGGGATRTREALCVASATADVDAADGVSHTSTLPLAKPHTHASHRAPDGRPRRCDDCGRHRGVSLSSSPPPPPPCHLRACMDAADVHVVNDASSIAHLFERLAALDLTHPDRLRPSWDSYFMRMANLASMRTNCMKRRVGAVIVRDRRVIATGYNGTPRGTRNCLSGGCARCNGHARAGHALDECLCLHAEENAIIEAGRERCTGATLYTSLCPCLACSKKIAQAGIVQVVYGVQYVMDAMSAALFADAGVVIRRHGADGAAAAAAGVDSHATARPATAQTATRVRATAESSARNALCCGGVGGNGDDAGGAADAPRDVVACRHHQQDDELRSPSRKFSA